MRHRLTAWVCGVCGLYGPLGSPVAAAPDAGAAIDAWMRARAAVDAGDATMLADHPADLHGVRLVLRHDGRPLAAAAAAKATGESTPLQTATQNLLEKARADGALAELPTAIVTEGLARTTLELDAAGPLTPMTATNLADAASDLNPAADGVALRVGDQWHLRYPSALRMSGAAATLEMLVGLAAVAGFTPESLDSARRTGTATLYRFQTITLVQCGDELSPRVYERGRESSLWHTSREATLAQLSRVGQHLLLQCWDDPDGELLHVGGDYVPPHNHCQPVHATARDHAFVALALRRLSAIPGLPEQLNVSSRLAADALEAQLGTDDPVIVAVRSQLDPTSNMDSVRILLSDDTAPRVERAIAAWALAGNTADHEAVKALIDETAVGPRQQLFGMLPWIGWADLAQAKSLGQPPRLERLWQGLRSVTLNEVNPRTATADMLPVAAFLASRQKSSADRSLKLLNLLVVGPHESRFFRSPTRAVGGVRLAPWNERMPVWAQALGVLLLCEALEQLDDPLLKEPNS